jgi:hypothetical protein
MHGIHDVGSAPTTVRNVAVNAQRRAALCPFIERVLSLRPPRALTAFTSSTLLRELRARLERTRLSSSPSQQRAPSSRSAKPVRWCGASPLELERAAWRERRRTSR